MRIAQIAPLIERVPPKKYGGTERVVHALTEELVKRGHQITLFASGDSLTSAKLISVHPRNLREAKINDVYGTNYLSMLNIGLAYSMQDKFDIIHDHTDHLSLPTANIAKVPVVMTMHGAISDLNKRLNEVLNKPKLVSISFDQQSSSPHLNWVGNIYNGLKMDHYPFSTRSDGYLLFVGRICLEKGTHLAIEVAQYLDLPLIIAAKVESVDVQYFKEYVEPKLSEQIRWVGEVDETERNKLMSRALCLLHPNTWREPFGLTLIEAQACGTPVIAFNKGSTKELIVSGETGYIVEDVTEMINAVLNLNLINRKNCRQHVLENFNVERMVDGYETIYRKILQKQQTPDNNLTVFDSL